MRSLTWSCCIKCKGKVLVCRDVVGECTKCGAKMKLNKCGLQHMAKIVTEEQEGGEHTLTLFGEHWRDCSDMHWDKVLQTNC